MVFWTIYIRCCTIFPMSLLKDLASRLHISLLETRVVSSVAFEKQCVRCGAKGASRLTVYEDTPTPLGRRLGLRPIRRTHEGLLSGGCGNAIIGCPDRRSHKTEG